MTLGLDALAAQRIDRRFSRGGRRPTLGVGRNPAVRALRHVVRHDVHRYGCARHRGTRHVWRHHRRRDAAFRGQLLVGKETRETGRVRLRTYMVTEEEQRTVPARKEKVRVEREPITEETIDRAMSGPELSEEKHEVVLHEERPVAATETVPVERVRLSKDTEAREETVAGQARKERVDPRSCQKTRSPDARVIWRAARGPPAPAAAHATVALAKLGVCEPDKDR